MKQTSIFNYIVWLWLGLFLLAAAALLGGGFVMFVLGLLGRLG
ncbi:MAG: hypothetical protein HDKAJFGB_02676 [Anaerolineae bacterium]|nr:hypothetical protein [Anaerolineae bacterium]